MTGDPTTPRLGFACHWDDPAPPTWSYTPWNLRAALRDSGDVIDLGVQFPAPVRAGLKAVSARRRAGEWRSSWRQSPVTDALVGRALRRNEERCDVVVQIQDLARFQRPSFIYQDLSYDLLLHSMEHNPSLRQQFAALTPHTIAQRRARQQQIYDESAGVLAMSEWFADSLVKLTGLERDRVHVVHPGANAAPSDADLGQVPDRLGHGSPPRLLFVGRDFHRKGGDLVVAAFTTLRQRGMDDLQLTVVGPSEWPLDGDPPPGVDFLGHLPVAQVARLFASHDVFVMPSRFEAFGIVLAEALSWGLPCVARRQFAMPEMVEDGHNGALVPPDATIGDVADAIASMVEDGDLRLRVRREAPVVREQFSWERAAGDVRAVATT